MAAWKNLVGAAAIVLLLAVAGSCRRGPPREAGPPKLETKEVGAAPDAHLSTEGDAVERRRESKFAGVLPGGFPKDLPVYEPSSLIDFGAGPGGAFAVFQTPDDAARVGTRYPALVVARGWVSDGNGYSRGGRRVRISVENIHPGARIRVEY